MTQYQNGPFGYSGRSAVGYESNLDAGTMAKFFNAVYAWMAVGLALTAVVAWATADSPNLQQMARSGPILIVAFIVEIGLVMAISGAINKINRSHRHRAVHALLGGEWICFIDPGFEIHRR